jgi:hypothetical protein
MSLQTKKKEMKKTPLQKALNNEFSKDDAFFNLDTAIELSKKLKVYDLIEPNGKTITIVAEIINRLQNAEFEVIDYGDFEA